MMRNLFILLCVKINFPFNYIKFSPLFMLLFTAASGFGVFWAWLFAGFLLNQIKLALLYLRWYNLQVMPCDTGRT